MGTRQREKCALPRSHLVSAQLCREENAGTSFCTLEFVALVNDNKLECTGEVKTLLYLNSRFTLNFRLSDPGNIR